MNKKPSLCNESVFKQFFKDQSKSLVSYLYYRFGNKTQAEDVSQEAFTKLWQKCMDVPLEKAKSFLFTVATNLFTSLKRHEQVKLRYQEKSVNIHAYDREIETPEYLIIEKEFMEKLTKTIESLPEKQRTAYLLSRVEQKTYREIAEMMEVSVKAIEKLMHKALVKIRVQLKDIKK